MVHDPDPEKLDALKARIRQAETAAGLRPPDHKNEEPAGRTATSLARIGSDFVATVVVCTLLGALADYEIGTKPWGLLIMLLAGFLTGVVNVWRALEGTQASGPRKKEENKRN